LAIIVDKAQKRRDIALSCIELLLEKGIKKLTVAEVAKKAKVSKGSIYDYFENKEDIVFEIIRSDIENYHKEFESKLNQNISSRDKIFLVFDFLLNDNEKFEKHQNIYKEYTSINLCCSDIRMEQFNSECTIFFKSIIETIIDNGISKDELIVESKGILMGLLALEKGFLFMKWTENRGIKDELRDSINLIFDLIEKKTKKDI
jgi:AcrR family transcriptional regulator